MKRTFFTSLLAAGLTAAAAQAPVSLVNPSFEGRTGHSQTPEGWKNCGQPGESPPDVQPDFTFGVRQPSMHGRSYIGMVARDNNTTECVYQALAQPLLGGQCYQFSLYASRSDIYESQSRLTGEYANFNKPLMINIWGGAQTDNAMIPLGAIGPVWHTEWVRYDLELWVSETCNTLYIEADFTSKTPYNGNVLIDDLSELTPMPCTDSLINFVSFGPVDARNLPLPIDTLSLMEYALAEDMKQHLKAAPIDPSFAASSRINTQLYYADGPGLEGWSLYRSNPYLHKLALISAQLDSNERLVLRVKGKRAEAKPLAAQLKLLLDSLNLDTRLQIDYGSKFSRRIAWLAENDWVKIGIISE